MSAIGTELLVLAVWVHKVPLDRTEGQVLGRSETVSKMLLQNHERKLIRDQGSGALFQVAFEVVKNCTGIGPGSCRSHYLMRLGVSTSKQPRKQ